MITEEEWPTIKALLKEQVELSKSNTSDDSVCDKLDVYWYRMTDKDKKQFIEICKEVVRENNNSRRS